MTSVSSEALGLSRSGWRELVLAESLPAYRADQIFEALHRRGVRSFGDIRELPAELRDRLERQRPIRLPEIVRRDASSDGSVKYGLRLEDGALIEAVFMPGGGSTAVVNEFEDARAAARKESGGHRVIANHKSQITNRFTVCLSSQTGCAVDCAFCVTGRLGGGRNLTPGEIVGQLYAVLEDSGRTTQGLRVVFMGMGEPFLNPEGVLPALEILLEVVPARRVTVSTSGIVPAFERFAALPRRPNLAVSINAADPQTRERLMPITRTHSLASVVTAMRAWPADRRHPITAEYVLIAGLNDSREDAMRLAALLRGIAVKVNLIPLNEDPVYLPGWKRPAEEAIDRFAATLRDAGTRVTVRRSRGPDASAACGQLKGRTADLRKRRPSL